MKIFFGLLLFCSFLAGCSDDKAASTSGSMMGTRDFKIDDSKPAFVVELYGVTMGTPDTAEVMSVIAEANDQGHITETVDMGPLFEGGISSCYEVPDATARKQIIDDLQSVETSMKESFYSIESVNDCR